MTSLRWLLLLEVGVVHRGGHDGHPIYVPAMAVGVGQVRHGDVRGGLLRGGGRRVEAAVSAPGGLGHRLHRRSCRVGVLEGRRLLLGNNSVVTMKLSII